MRECTDENINNAMERVNKLKAIDVDSDNEDERIGQLMILCIEEGFNEAIRSHSIPQGEGVGDEALNMSSLGSSSSKDSSKDTKKKQGGKK